MHRFQSLAILAQFIPGSSHSDLSYSSSISVLGPMKRICVFDEFLHFMCLCDSRMLGRCSRGLHEEDVILKHILLRMRVGQPIRVYKQVVAAEITAIAAVLQRATSVNLDFSGCDGITDVGLQAIAAL